MKANKKIKLNQYYPLKRGMENGAQDFAIGGNSDINTALINDSFYKKYERDAFIIGYNLGYQEKYSQIWKENKNLLFSAYDNNDIKPIGWFLSSGIDGRAVEEC